MYYPCRNLRKRLAVLSACHSRDHRPPDASDSHKFLMSSWRALSVWTASIKLTEKLLSSVLSTPPSVYITPAPALLSLPSLFPRLTPVTAAVTPLVCPPLPTHHPGLLNLRILILCWFVPLLPWHVRCALYWRRNGDDGGWPLSPVIRTEMALTRLRRQTSSDALCTVSSVRARAPNTSLVYMWTVWWNS